MRCNTGLLVTFLTLLAPMRLSAQPSLLGPTSRFIRPHIELFDPDPQHLWNRLRVALLARPARDGFTYGLDSLDPLLWSGSRYLLDEPRHTQALQMLDEFLAHHGETLIKDPLRRLLLQNDLWAVFDWASDEEGSGETQEKDLPRRRDLARRLSEVIRRLALSKEMIDAIPDNLSAAARAFANDFDPTHPHQPFLPPNLLDRAGPWVAIGDVDEIARLHQSQFPRSAFHVLINLPGGRAATIDYIARIAKFLSAESNRSTPATQPSAIPEFPPGTRFALLRMMLAIDDHGRLVPTHLTQSVQLRLYHRAGLENRYVAADPAQFVEEFQLERPKLLAGHDGGLAPLSEDKREFQLFMRKGLDEIDDDASHFNFEQRAELRLKTCTNCHGSVMTFSLRDRVSSALYDTDERRGFQMAIFGKQRSYSWGLLQGLLEPRITATSRSAP